MPGTAPQMSGHPGDRLRKLQPDLPLVCDRLRAADPEHLQNAGRVMSGTACWKFCAAPFSSVSDKVIKRATLRIAMFHLRKGCLYEVCITPFLLLSCCSRQSRRLFLPLRSACLPLRTASHCTRH